MSKLIIVVLSLLIVSFLCSILESVLLSLSKPYIQVLIDKKNRTGNILNKLKDNIEEPIAAILTLNTISHTVGATLSGALALRIFGSEWMALFSGILTLIILVFSEIIPKTLGAHYWKSLSPVSGYILKVMILVLKPFIVPVQFISKVLSRKDSVVLVSKQEIYNFIRIGYCEGVLESSEFKIIDNLFHLKTIKVSEIMTPRTVVSWLDCNLTIDEVLKQKLKLQFSRLPLYDARNNIIEGVVLRRDIMNRIADKKTKATLKSISSHPLFIPETQSVFRVMNQLIAGKLHLAIVLNEYGDFTGIITVEDALETLLGMEIVDEFDPAVDMRELARKKKKKL